MIYLGGNKLGAGDENLGVATDLAHQKRYSRAKVSKEPVDTLVFFEKRKM